MERRIAVYRAFALARERLAFPFGEGGPLAVEEVLPQYEFAESHQQNVTGYCTSPAPSGGTLPKGEGLFCSTNRNLILLLVLKSTKIE